MMSWGLGWEDDGMQRHEQTCPTCDGDGGQYVPDILSFQKCKRCGGSGKVDKEQASEQPIRKDKNPGTKTY